MKRIMALLLALCLALCACSNKDSESVSEENKTEAVVQPDSPKGSLENPYQVGETIIIEEMYPANTHHQRETPFQMEITITETYTPEQGASLREDDQIPVAEITLSFSGEYKSGIDLNHFFYRSLLTETLQEEWTKLFEQDNSQREVRSLRADQEYTLTLTASRGDTPLKYYPYLKFSYHAPDCNNINFIYIDLSTGYSPNSDIAPDITEAEQESYYQAAAAAEEKGYYAVAKSYYESILGYRDSQARYYSVRGKLTPYNGTYYGPSDKYNDVFVWLYIQDGTVWVTYDEANTPTLKYELFQYKTTPDGTPIMAFSSSLSRFFLDNHNASYTDGFTFTNNNGEWIVQATEGSQDNAWSCTLEKVSDTVDIELD